MDICTPGVLRITADDAIDSVYLNGMVVNLLALPNRANWVATDAISMPSSIHVIAVEAFNKIAGPAGIRASSSDSRVITSDKWKCVTSVGTHAADWMTVAFDDSRWPAATLQEPNGGSVHGNTVFNMNKNAWFIWSSAQGIGKAFCRLHF